MTVEDRSLYRNREYNQYRRNKHKLIDSQLEKTPLGKFLLWCIRKSAGTTVEKSLNNMIVGSLAGRIFTAIAISVILGFVFNYSFSFLAEPYSYAVCAILGTVAGIAGQGAGGAIVGTIWGWLFGKIIDATISKVSYEPITNYLGTYGAWIIAVIIGWYAGRLAACIFEEISYKYSSAAREILVKIVATVIIVSMSIFVVEIGMEISNIGSTSLSLPILPILSSATADFWIFVGLLIVINLRFSDYFNFRSKEVEHETISWILGMLLFLSFIVSWAGAINTLGTDWYNLAISGTVWGVFFLSVYLKG
jgi:hypothetical protein